MALGCNQEFVTQDIEEVLKKADGVMYAVRLRKTEISEFCHANLLKTLGEKDYETEEHVWRMQKIGISWECSRTFGYPAGQPGSCHSTA